MSKRNSFNFGITIGQMSIQDYGKRILEIADYYHARCEKYKKNFYTSCLVRMIASALIPVISLSSEVDWSSIVVSFLAAVITLSEGYASITKCYKKWIVYRETCNALWAEQRQYSVITEIYKDVANRDKIFIERCEAILKAEADEWKNYIERLNAS